MVKAKVKLVKQWILSNKLEFACLAIILLVASFMRLYKIAGYMTFLGDEGRDVIIVRRFLTELHPMLIGPGTSIGNMYLGPFYYYMMAPALLLANYSPVGPAVMIAVLGIVTVFLVWFFSREWFGKEAAFIASLLYAIAPTIIVYSRSSWNPNIMPFFALVSIYGIWRVWKFNQMRWLPVIGFCLAACLQSHYLSLLLVPTLGLFWLLTFYNLKKSKRPIKKFLLMTSAALFIFLFLMSPLVIFDARHEWRNFGAMKLFFTDRQATVSIKPWNAIPAIWPQLEKISSRLIAGYDMTLGMWAALLVAATALFLFTKKKIIDTQNKSALFLLLVWLGLALLGLGLYKQEIYDHYYGFFFPAPFILLGAFLGRIVHTYKIRGRWLAGTVLVLLVWVNLSNSPLRQSPNMQLSRSVEVSNFIREQVGNEKFNFAVIAERNYEGAYRYFFNRSGDPVVDIDPQNTADTIARQLFVVCEKEVSKCDPTHNPKAEIANFGWSKIDSQWTVSGVTVFKLVHSLPEKTS